MGKKDSARKKHLKRIRDRRQASIPQRFTVSNKEIFLRVFDKLYIPFLLFAILAVILFIIHSVSFQAKSHLPKGQLIPQWRSQDEEIYRYKYSGGYQIFEITEKSFIFSEDNSLPRDFSIDWVNSAFDFLKEGMVRVKLSGLTYRMLGVAGSDIRVTFLRDPGTQKIVLKSPQAELWLEVLRDDGKNLLCLIGIKLLTRKVR